MHRLYIARSLAIFSVFTLLLLVDAGRLHGENHPYQTRIGHTEAAHGFWGRPILRLWEDPDGNGLSAAPAPRDTFVIILDGFQTGANCFPWTWTVSDFTAQSGAWFHVDSHQAISGTQSLWCGASTGLPLCLFESLPGYGNNWNQAWCTKLPVAVSGDLVLDVSFDAVFDSEPGRDVTVLEYTTDLTGMTGWTLLEDWDGNNGAVSVSQAFNVSGPSILVRFRFHSDGKASDEDGLWPSTGAVHIDNLQVEALPLEDFENYTEGSTGTNDWKSCDPGAFGTYLGLFKNIQLAGASEIDNLGCKWAAIVGSTAFYSCVFPSQAAVPFTNAAGHSLHNELISQEFDLWGSGNEFRLWFSAYAAPLDNLVFYTWSIRTNDASCVGPWKDLGYMYYLGRKDGLNEGGWIRHVANLGAFVDTNKPKMQLAFGVVDMSNLWSGTYGTGTCHSAAPLLDSVKLYRIDSPGPQWSIRDMDQFQDNFVSDGPATVRADMAQDILPLRSADLVTPGDSAVVTVFDPAGLKNDPVNGGKKVYAYVTVVPTGQPGKSGAALSGGTRWPHVGPETIAGTPWTILRLDQCVVNGAAVTDRYCLDLNDALFEPGDQIQFFYSAENTNGEVTFGFGTNLGRQGTSKTDAAANPAEFTCLPFAGSNRILYVDGTDGRGNQPYFDSAFQMMSMTAEVDRYDVRGPSSGVNNNLRTRVGNASLLSNYNRIIWDTGDLDVSLAVSFSGNTPNPKKDDFQILNDFLASLTSPGGVYLSGDDIAQELASSFTASGVTFFSNYLPFSLLSPNHRHSPSLFSVSPKVIFWPGRAFSDNFVAFGGTPYMNDFDVMGALGATRVEMSYNTSESANGAVISKVTGNARVLLSGFSFGSIRDDELDGTSDRALHLYEVLSWLGGGVNFPTATGPAVKSSLSQNYPNPFNPTTNIAFSVRERGRVSLTIYGLAGERVRTLANEELPAGAHSRSWDGLNDHGQQVASGVYFYRIAAGDFTATKKMVLLK